MPRVSVLIPTYNCARYLSRAIDSVIAQTYKDYEIIVIDDGSTDDTKQVIDRYGNRVKYSYQSNRGLSAARNASIDNSTGELIAYLDADDLWYENRLALGVAFLDQYRECGMVHSEVAVIDDDDKPLYSGFNKETKRAVPQGQCVIDLLKRNHIQVPTVLERRQCLLQAGLFPESLIAAQDYYHWIMIALHGWSIGYISAPLAVYRWRRGSLMSSKRVLLEDYEHIFGSLLKAELFDEAQRQEAAHIIRSRRMTTQRELAYLDRIEGRARKAVSRSAFLVKECPFQLSTYVDLMKSCLSMAVSPFQQTKLFAK